MRVLMIALFCASLFSASRAARAQENPMPGDAQSAQAGRARQREGLAGTITAISSGNMQVKSAEGEIADVRFNDATQFHRARKPAQLKDFKVGDEIIVRGTQGTDGVWQADLIALRPGASEMQQQFRENLGKTFIAGE